jgi:hypothetical protein
MSKHELRTTSVRVDGLKKGDVLASGGGGAVVGTVTAVTPYQPVRGRRMVQVDVQRPGGGKDCSHFTADATVRIVAS